MTWIKTIAPSEGDEKLRAAREQERSLYPKEYAEPTGITDEAGSIVASHSLIPEALYHAFATFGALMSPDLPLSAPAARDDHDDRLGRPTTATTELTRTQSFCVGSPWTTS